MNKNCYFPYPLMQLLCQELQSLINFKVVNCLSYHRQRFFLVLQGPHHQEERLFFCFDAPFLRFHLTYSQPIPKKNDSNHPLKVFLREGLLKKVSILQQDRILQLDFQTPQGKRLLIAEFFSKHPNYYLTQADGTILFALYPPSYSHYQLPLPRSYPLFSARPLWSSHAEVEQAYIKLEKQWEFDKQKQRLIQQSNKQIKKLRRKELEVVENLKQCARWGEVQHEGELIKFHFSSIKKGMSSLVVQDWMTEQPYTLSLDPLKTAQEQMARRFQKAKKLQTGVSPLNKHLEDIQIKLQKVQQQQQKLLTLSTSEELETFKTSLFPSLPIPPLSSSKNLSLLIYREYYSATGTKIWVGKNAKANDRLTFQLANGRDWWLHSRDYSGSHVIIRLAKDEKPDQETLKDAFQLALYYSKARGQQEGEICFTQRKYVSKLGKKKAGLVQISKHQTAWVRFDPARYQTLKERPNIILHL